MKCTITRAISKLKTLEKKYKKELANSTFISIRTVGFQGKPESEILSNCQSVDSIYERIFEIKRKIYESNAVTKVVICGKTMTIQEALIIKDILPERRSFINKLKSQCEKVQNTYSTEIEKNIRRVEQLTRDTSDKKANNSFLSLDDDWIEVVSKKFPVTIVDPWKVKEKLPEMIKQLDDFISEVNIVISESNSITYIEIND